MAAFVLPFLDDLARDLVQPTRGMAIDFTKPVGEAALVPVDSVSWRVFKNPVALFVGGVAAVILEFAEPAVRSGVWEHSSFRRDPVQRLRRTGMAAMITVYGARSEAQRMIARVVELHDKVQGRTPAGEAYAANDPDLLAWVHATAGFGFAEAYRSYVHSLDEAELDRFYDEGHRAAMLYGAAQAPHSHAELIALFESKQSRLEASPIVFEFIAIMRTAPIFPAVLRPLQRLMVRAAIDLVPAWVRQRLGLDAGQGLKPWQRKLVRLAGTLADRMILHSSPPVQACRRMGLPADYLYR
jgi:uncharacterized protein (DUF2236 family)